MTLGSPACQLEATVSLLNFPRTLNGPPALCAKPGPTRSPAMGHPQQVSEANPTARNAPKTVGPQSRRFPPRRHLARSRPILGCHSSGVGVPPVGRAQGPRAQDSPCGRESSCPRCREPRGAKTAITDIVLDVTLQNTHRPLAVCDNKQLRTSKATNEEGPVVKTNE